ncbi:MAG: N-acetyltransferase [Rhodoblastus sp.]|nr:MAG: N-acetyltransferase [Rhodoblastus sp.]
MSDLILTLSPESPADEAVVEKLAERAFGPGRFARTAYRLREGVTPAYSLSLIARVATLIVGANRMTPIRLGGHPALLLGPLIVDPAFHGRGIGGALVEKSCALAAQAGWRLVFLVGDAPYYERFGFKRVPMGRLTMPGPVDPARMLVRELVPGAFEGVSGAVARAG